MKEPRPPRFKFTVTVKRLRQPGSTGAFFGTENFRHIELVASNTTEARKAAMELLDRDEVINWISQGVKC